MMRSFMFWSFVAALASNLNSSALAQRVNYEEAPISYSTSKPDNRISQLQDRLGDHTVSLAFDEQTGYLRSLLETLRVPVSSQVLTFGRTSLQDDRISPTTPRAIYFADDIHLGFVQNGLIEIAVQDSKLGMVFYTLKQTPDEPPVFLRQTNSCLTCHGAARTKNVPGVLIRSVYPDPEGHPVVAAGSFLSTHRSPLSQRWGGWYVTGRHGDQQHLGNFVLTSVKKPKTIDNTAGHNLEGLADRFDTSKYLSPHSDLVALMVLEHQTDTLNVLTQASFEVRHAEYLMSQAGENSEQKAAAEKLLSDRLVKNTEQIVKAFLFADEVALTSPVSGTSEFVTQFSMNSNRDSKGRSLRDFELQTRMFRFPCSYLIETPAFRDLPETLREQVLIRLSKFLKSDETIKGLERHSAMDRTAILEILRETVPGFPAN